MTAALHDPVHAAAGLATRLTATWLEIGAHACDVGARYWGGALARGATPLDVADDLARWSRVVHGRREPTWASPNVVVSESPIVRLRDFSPAGATATTPTLILPPQAGHHSCIVDYSAQQSQVVVAIEAGLDRLFVLEWREATSVTASCSIVDYVAAVRDAIDLIGGPVHLIGDCQGGWLATIVTALHPAAVASLTVGGAPIDFHAGEGPLLDHVALVAGLGGASYRSLVAAGGGLLRGEVMLGGFVALAPEEEIAKQLDLFLVLDDPDLVRRYEAFEDWFKHTQDIAGAFYLWIIDHLFEGNMLVQGTLEVAGKRVDLAAIRCPVTILAGSRDHITPPAQAFALADHVGTPPGDVRRALVDAGHLGLFMGRAPLREHWQPLLSTLASG